MTGRAATGPPWTVRAFRAGDEAQVVELFATCFGRTISVDHLRWKLHTLESPVEPAWVAEADGTIVAHYAGIPVRLWLDGSEHQAMVPVDGMVHPELRRSGVITSVVAYGRRRWVEAGVSLGLLLPNEQWGSRAQLFGWQRLFPLRWRRLLLRPSAALARRTRLGFLARLEPLDRAARAVLRRGPRGDDSVELRRVLEVGPELDRLWQAARGRVHASLVRDSGWVSWRYLQAPSADYHVLLAERAGVAVGYVAYRFVEEDGGRWATLADLFADPVEPALADTLIARTVDRLDQLGVVSVSALAIPDTALDRALRRAGFGASEGEFGVHAVRYAARFSLEPLQDPGRWVLSGGDFDVV